MELKTQDKQKQLIENISSSLLFVGVDIAQESLAGILGEAGDLSGYAHGNALLRHAGLNLAEASSGKWCGKMVLSKRGRPRL